MRILAILALVMVLMVGSAQAGTEIGNHWPVVESPDESPTLSH